jgi:hypothetical protein
LCRRRVSSSQPEVLLERGVEDVGVLGYEPDQPPVIIAAQIADLGSVELDRPALVGQEPQQNIGERRLAGPAAADHRHAPTAEKVEIEPVEHPRPSLSVPGAQAPHPQRPRRIG